MIIPCPLSLYTYGQMSRCLSRIQFFFADLEPEASFDGIGCGWCTRRYLLVAGSPKTRFRNASLMRYGRRSPQISSTPNAPVGRSEVTSAILTEKITLFSSVKSFHRFLVLNRKFRSLIFQHRLLTQPQKVDIFC